MKISQKQAAILAQEIHKKLRTNTSFVSDSTKQAVRQFISKRERLLEVKEKAQEAINEHDRTLKKFIGKCRTISAYHDYDRMLKELETANIPNACEIEDKIILKAMFVDADDMEKFVDSIIKEFTKKKAKIPADN